MDVQKGEREVLGDRFTCRDMRHGWPRTGPQAVEFEGELDGERVKITAKESRHLSAVYGSEGRPIHYHDASRWEVALYDRVASFDDDGRPLYRVFDEDYYKALRRVVEEWRARRQRA